MLSLSLFPKCLVPLTHVQHCFALTSRMRIVCPGPLARLDTVHQPGFPGLTEPGELSGVSCAQVRTTELLVLFRSDRRSIQLSFLAVWKDEHHSKSSKIFSAKNWIGFCASSATKCPQPLMPESLMPFAVSLLRLNASLSFFSISSLFSFCWLNSQTLKVFRSLVSYLFFQASRTY